MSTERKCLGTWAENHTKARTIARAQRKIKKVTNNKTGGGRSTLPESKSPRSNQKRCEHGWQISI